MSDNNIDGRYRPTAAKPECWDRCIMSISACMRAKITNMNEDFPGNKERNVIVR